MNNNSNGNKMFNPPGKPTGSMTNQNSTLTNQQIYNNGMNNTNFSNSNFNPATTNLMMSNMINNNNNQNINSNMTNKSDSNNSNTNLTNTFSASNIPNLINSGKSINNTVMNTSNPLANTRVLQPNFKANQDMNLLTKSIRETSNIDSTNKVENGGSVNESTKLLSKRRLQDLLVKVDPMERLDPDAEEVLLEIGDEFIESVCEAACKLAKHRKSNTLQVKDVQLHLERNWNLRIPGFSSDEVRTIRKLNLPSSQNSKLLAIHQAKLNKKVNQNQPNHAQTQIQELPSQSPNPSSNLKVNTPGVQKSVNTPSTPTLESNKN